MYEKIFLAFFKNKNFKGILKLQFQDKIYTFGNKIDDLEDNRLVDNVTVNVENKNFFKRVIFFGDTGFGEAYFLSEFKTDNLKNLLLWFLQNSQLLPSFRGRNLFFIFFNWGKLFLNISHLKNRNTKEGSKKNIKNHYDVSNSFYQLWLDSTMTYSSAVFNDKETLERAQENKYKIICENIKLSKDDNLLEIGSGWGGFAIFAAKNFNCQVTTVTISEKQYAFAKQRIKEEGLENKIDIKLQDYRDIEGSYQKIVSIEMMEALGYEYVPGFIDKCNSLLASDGAMCFQCITYPDKDFEIYLKNPNYIKKYIFPGGELISLAQIKNHLQKIGNLNINTIKSIGQDYAKTLNIWKENFLSKKQEILKLGFNEEFFLKWLYYFVYCEVGFETSYIDNYQIVIEKNN